MEKYLESFTIAVRVRYTRGCGGVCIAVDVLIAVNILVAMGVGTLKAGCTPVYCECARGVPIELVFSRWR